MAKVIEIEWKGESYTLNENEAFRAADAIEDVVTVFELQGMLADIKALKLNKLARAYSALLSEAGASASPQEVRRAMSNDMAKARGKDDGPAMWGGAIVSLLNILFDGAPEGEGGEKSDAGKS